MSLSNKNGLSREKAPLSSELSVSIHEVPTEDRYIDDDYETITSLIKERMAEGFYGDNSLDLARKRTSTIDMENPSTKWMYDNLPGFGNWHSLVPTAGALDPIYRPNITTLPNGKELTPEVRSWLHNIHDAIGIRSRAAQMENIIIDEVLRDPRPEGHQWVSLASGAAQPVFESMNRISESGARVPNVTLVDYDKKALALASKLADEQSHGANVQTKRVNILNKSGIVSRREQFGFFRNALSSASKLQPENYDMVDAVGILEYLKEDDWEYSYNGVISTKKKMAGARNFLTNAFELVRPGGLLVVGNMRDTHPQLGFTLNTIQWPHIQPRSIEDMVRICNEAGLEGQLDVYCPQDGVYAIYAIRKPE